jgi:hypothetical protein
MDLVAGALPEDLGLGPNSNHSNFILPENLECATIVVGSKMPLELPLGQGGDDCFQIFSENSTSLDSKHVLLTMRNPVYGRYAVRAGGFGYSWAQNADGIYYCADIAMTGDVFTFDEYPDISATDNAPIVMTIDVEYVSNGDICNSGVISYGGVVPLDSPGNGDSTEIFWSSHKYYLGATHFEYALNGEEAVTMKNAAEVHIGGDPGSNERLTIEIRWLNEFGNEKRFNGYIDANDGMWTMSEARVYNAQGNLVQFNSTKEKVIMKGEKDACFKADSLVVPNDNGDVLKFEQITLAAFLPWADESTFLECVHGIILQATVPKEVDTQAVQEAISSSLGLNTFQVTVLEAASKRRFLQENSTYQVQITSNSKDDAQSVHCAAISEKLEMQKNDVLQDVSIVRSSVKGDCPTLTPQPDDELGSSKSGSDELTTLLKPMLALTLWLTFALLG